MSAVPILSSPDQVQCTFRVHCTWYMGRIDGMLEIVTLVLGPVQTNAYLAADGEFARGGGDRPCLGW